jgi:RNA polymerase sigma-70 factor (ECF subfamily)
VTVSHSDAELVRRALGGSQSAYHDLVARYAAPAVNLAARIVGDRGVAEDLAQEAFTRAFRRLSTYDSQRKFSSWFFQIVHNVTVAHLRRRRVETVSINQIDPSGAFERFGAAPGPSPDEQAARAAMNEALDRALAGIRPEYREALVLRYQEALSDSEIAAIMDVPIGTVKTYLFRARKELASILSERGWGATSSALKPAAGTIRKVTDDT